MAFTTGQPRSFREQVAALEVVELWRRLTRYFYLAHAVSLGVPGCLSYDTWDCYWWLHPTVYRVLFPYLGDDKPDHEALYEEWRQTPYPTTTTSSQTCGAVLVYPFFYAFLLAKICVYAVMFVVTMSAIVGIVFIVGIPVVVGQACIKFAKWFGRLAWTVSTSCALCMCEAVCRVRLVEANGIVPNNDQVVPPDHSEPSTSSSAKPVERFEFVPPPIPIMVVE